MIIVRTTGRNILSYVRTPDTTLFVTALSLCLVYDIIYILHTYRLKLDYDIILI